MNFERLSQNAVSYSSASITKKAESVSRAETPKPCGTPPTRNDGFSPASSRIHVSSAVVVVLPCVPATPNTHRPRRMFSASHCGPETNARLRSRTASNRGFPREIAFPTTNRSGSSDNWATSYPETSSIPCSSSWVLIGGYTLASHPVTRCPAARASRATPPMKVPQMPMM
jgi:hypothetical protein